MKIDKLIRAFEWEVFCNTTMGADSTCFFLNGLGEHTTRNEGKWMGAGWVDGGMDRWIGR